MNSHLIGYARVSTSKQTTDQQTDALRAAGASRIFEDTISGAKRDRPGLDELLAFAREGDTIVIVALDRLGRSMSHVIQTIEELQERGIQVEQSWSLREAGFGPSEIAKLLGCSRATVYRALDRAATSAWRAAGVEEARKAK